MVRVVGLDDNGVKLLVDVVTSLVVGGGLGLGLDELKAALSTELTAD